MRPAYCTTDGVLSCSTWSFLVIGSLVVVYVYKGYVEDEDRLSLMDASHRGFIAYVRTTRCLSFKTIINAWYREGLFVNFFVRTGGS